MYKSAHKGRQKIFTSEIILATLNALLFVNQNFRPLTLQNTVQDCISIFMLSYYFKLFCVWQCKASNTVSGSSEIALQFKANISTCSQNMAESVAGWNQVDFLVIECDFYSRWVVYKLPCGTKSWKTFFLYFSVSNWQTANRLATYIQTTGKHSTLLGAKQKEGCLLQTLFDLFVTTFTLRQSGT